MRRGWGSSSLLVRQMSCVGILVPKNPTSGCRSEDRSFSELVVLGQGSEETPVGTITASLIFFCVVQFFLTRFQNLRGKVEIGGLFVRQKTIDVEAEVWRHGSICIFFFSVFEK